MKDYENWHKLKSKIDSSEFKLFFKDREIWWCSVGSNVGDEEDGKSQFFSRPVLIIKKLNNRIFVGVPLSTKLKEDFLYCAFSFKEKQQSAIIGQVKTFDSKRLIRKIGRLNRAEFDKIKKELKKLLF